MAARKTNSRQRPRELRRRVVLPARLRIGAQWSDTCILNISKRGLMIHSGRITPGDGAVELRRGEHVIVARVVWREGARVGLQCEDCLPVEEILSADGAQALRPTAGAVTLERRRQPRIERSDARVRARALEFVALASIGAVLAIGGWLMTEAALAKPMALVAIALG